MLFRSRLQVSSELTSPAVQTRNSPINLVIAEGYLRFSNDMIMSVNSDGNLIIMDSSKASYASYGFPLQNNNMTNNISNFGKQSNILINQKSYTNKVDKIVFSNDMMIEKHRKDSLNIKGMNATLNISPRTNTNVISTAFQTKTPMSDLNKS